MGKLIDVERALEPYKILRNTDTLCVATIRQNILECPTVEAIPKADYENRLKADLVAMLTELQLEIEEMDSEQGNCDYATSRCIDREKVNDLIQEKINLLKEVKDENNN